MALAQAHCPRAILLDFDLPGEKGPSICRRLKAHPSTTAVPVAIVTGHAEESARAECFEAGADEYVLKPFSFRELHMRVCALIDGGLQSGVRGLTVGPLVVDFDTRRCSVDGARAELSRSEVALLRFLWAEASHICTNADLGQSIWGLDASMVDARVVDGLTPVLA